HFYFVTVTGIATPSIDARLVVPLGLRSDVKRVPIFGLGCVAGAAGLARVADALRGVPGEVAVLLAVELCSLTLQREDLSIPNIIASGLFGDGAAAAVLDGGARGRGPRIAATRSVFYPGTERVMGWDVVDSGFKVVLSPGVPQLVRDRLRADVDAFLAARGLQRKDIAHFICHTGGPKVLEAFEEALEVPRQAMQRSWDSLQTSGNLSSASVLFVLADLLASGEARPGDRGLLLAMGPGFCSELVLLEW
ncbi:MAG TPA: 3-oxoacyl-[acyl-carrier-protein] synthase III C-terminal domain-containing protein, partial [Myxococcales bacterium]|nr:3-oxoacyl-[acyl-carrier-protein] synthase III C-terminal domain-containing protein [Myxococcales bacterium]